MQCASAAHSLRPTTEGRPLITDWWEAIEAQEGGKNLRRDTAEIDQLSKPVLHGLRQNEDDLWGARIATAGVLFPKVSSPVFGLEIPTLAEPYRYHNVWPQQLQGPHLRKYKLDENSPHDMACRCPLKWGLYGYLPRASGEMTCRKKSPVSPQDQEEQLNTSQGALQTGTRK